MKHVFNKKLFGKSECISSTNDSTAAMTFSNNNKGLDFMFNKEKQWIFGSLQNATLHVTYLRKT